MNRPEQLPTIALACGGTGGHLFPGLALAEVLQERGCDVALLVSKKEVDQEAVKSAVASQVLPLPAVALQNGKWPSFLRGCWQSYGICRKAFQQLRPRAVIAMGGFTSAPPILAGKRMGAATFLHESNSIPGRANRWLSPWVDGIFVGFPTAARRLYNQSIQLVGTPVRSQFRPTDADACRMALGLQAGRPVLLVMGGSQGAMGINRLLLEAIPLLSARAPDLQYLHLSGPEGGKELQSVYAAHRCRAVVRPFLTEMELALGAATIAVNRAGASSLAELAAMQIPGILIPYPHATDDHQFYNARALVDTGAARSVDQASVSPETLAETILALLNDPLEQQSMRRALQQWFFPNAAEDMAEAIFRQLGLSRPPAALAQESFHLPKRAFAAAPLWKGSPKMASAGGKA